MTTKTIVFSIIVVASLLSFGVVAIQPIAFADDPEVPDIEKSKVKIKKKMVTAHIITEDKIPKDGSAGPFGYGVITSGDENVLAVTTHLCASDSPLQSNAPDDPCTTPVAGLLSTLVPSLSNDDFDGADWHPHILDLQDPSEGGFCESKGAFKEVDIPGTAVDFFAGEQNVSPTDYPFSVGGKSIHVKAPINAANVLPDGSGVTVVAFKLDLDASVDPITGLNVISDLCLLPLDD